MNTKYSQTYYHFLNNIIRSLSILFLFLITIIITTGCSNNNNIQNDAGTDADIDINNDINNNINNNTNNNTNDDFIDENGGSVNRLSFAVFGDVRPPDIDQDNNYPTDVVSQIFTQIADRAPQFVLGVGDWIFASDYNHAKNQMQSLLSAEQAYSHFVFHAMGNHECDGWTDSNCPNGDETGQVQAFYQFLWKFTNKPYWRFDINTDFGTSKFIIISPNAWNNEQKNWLQETLNDKTDYTFIIRHEPPSATNAPGINDSENIINSHNDITLILYGHEHYYEHLSANEVISGNGGAPIYGSGAGSFYGYLHVEQLEDGNIQVNEYKKGTDELMDSFKLSPTGKIVQ